MLLDVTLEYMKFRDTTILVQLWIMLLLLNFTLDTFGAYQSVMQLFL